MLLAGLAEPVIVAAAARKMTLCVHQNTSSGAGFRGSLEGWAKAGIKHVELNDRLLEEFVKTDSLAAARRLLGDLGLTPVCGAAVQPDFWNLNPTWATSLETWKRKCEQYASLGLKNVYAPSNTSRTVTLEDYKSVPDCIRQAGEAARQHNLTAMLEFTRSSTLLSTLTTSLKMIREAAHPNVRPMLDFYHFWSGLSKFEDLDLLRPGELTHVHFQDVPDLPRELLDSSTRFVPGEGIAPLVRILRKLADKGYAGPLSVELFRPEFQKGDPYEVARRIRRKAEPVMRQAKVM